MKVERLVPGCRCVLVGVGGVLVAACGARTQFPANPDAIQWSVPTTLPPSARVTTLGCDPTAPGECTFLLAMPDGYRIPPHSHPGMTHVAVREGTLLIEMEGNPDHGSAKALAAGDSLSIAAETHHSWKVRGPTLATLRFTGPFTITYRRAWDAPRAKVFPFGY